MSILSGMFGRRRAKPNSLVFEWSEKRRKELQYTGDFTPENIFAGLIYGLVTFVDLRPEPRHGKKRQERLLHDNLMKPYASDATLFELGCYMFFLIDLWLFQNRLDLYQGISAVFREEFVDLFAWALQITSVKDLFEERFSKYADIAESGAEPQELRDYLYELVLETNENQEPEHHDVDDEPFILVGALEEFALRTKLKTWETVMLPTILESLEGTTNIMQPRPTDKNAT